MHKRAVPPFTKGGQEAVVLEVASAAYSGPFHFMLRNNATNGLSSKCSKMMSQHPDSFKLVDLCT